ncbi:hypothetical protein V2J09_004119 [Rumex salicifolius]
MGCSLVHRMLGLCAVWVIIWLVPSNVNGQSAAQDATRLTQLFPHLSFSNDTSIFYGKPKLNGSSASISLDKNTGSGLVSNSKYLYGFFSAAMKLPAGYTSGLVVAFYLSNSEFFPHNHDELDFELLGHEKRKEWILQTNVYGNGSVKIGREEKFRLWFDPTAQFHEYSIIWNTHHVVFLVDNIPVREIQNTKAMSGGGAYPSKPMSVYATIWDASDWATHGGKYPIDYKYSPFVASLGSLEMSGCIPTQTCPYKPGSSSSSSSLDPVDGQRFIQLAQQQMTSLQLARSKYLIYSYCKDKRRYKVPPPECNYKPTH